MGRVSHESMLRFQCFVGELTRFDRIADPATCPIVLVCDWRTLDCVKELYRRRKRPSRRFVLLSSRPRHAAPGSGRTPRKRACTPGSGVSSSAASITRARIASASSAEPRAESAHLLRDDGDPRPRPHGPRARPSCSRSRWRAWGEATRSRSFRRERSRATNLASRSDREGLVKWYDNSAAGLEQGFTLTERPAGDGSLVIELACEARRPRCSRRGDLLGGIRTRLHYDHLVVA